MSSCKQVLLVFFAFSPCAATEADEIRNMNKEQRVMHYLKNHDSISTQQAMELCEYKTRAGACKLLDKMIQNDILRKIESCLMVM